MTIIFRRVLLSMVARRENSHLMSVDRVMVEEMASLLVDLTRTVLVTPQVKQFLVHGVRAELGDFPHVPENA